jgi:tRNA(fMet)-specific endonuclease VapC
MKRKYLLDTNICIYIRRKEPKHVLDHFKSFASAEVGMSVVTYGELWFGVENSQHINKNHVILQGLIQLIEPLPLPTKAVEHYGKIRHDLTKKGTIISNNDVWIAAHAMAENLILVSHNLKEFTRIPHLKVESWVTSI